MNNPNTVTDKRLCDDILAIMESQFPGHENFEIAVKQVKTAFFAAGHIIEGNEQVSPASGFANK
ncbi:MAG: hypothetical protein COT91_03970 [Candidatus Doudnabacteria bacterium CG10_big_fil_rev_8_21_14_0_10_41_10]|uniref:Uncharacterized protein n=1 Tax=Candidatus Doudnabacteria bacterium CG10_big_fil_rev_8_21_14_0_10_41_10 TaxID=1974551 RepID=A0A2H0VF18_9BACT|nr:MAG: hypothetical protein COT91_03970 [Candidatus Doudnabacteria bacterium CG10_big_fil_rev_8_21_14_0_10_41_10]